MIPKYKIRGAAREIAALMKQGRQRALATGKDVYLEYDLKTGTFGLLAPFPVKDEDEEEDDDEKPPPVRPKGYVYETVGKRKLPGGVHFQSVILGQERLEQSGSLRVRIPPFGMAEHHIVNLYDDSKREIAVLFNGFTGYLRFDDKVRGPAELLEDPKE